jgi:hypothetical protein
MQSSAAVHSSIVCPVFSALRCRLRQLPACYMYAVVGGGGGKKWKKSMRHAFVVRIVF